MLLRAVLGVAHALAALPIHFALWHLGWALVSLRRGIISSPQQLQHYVMRTARLVGRHRGPTSRYRPASTPLLSKSSRLCAFLGGLHVTPRPWCAAPPSP